MSAFEKASIEIQQQQLALQQSEQSSKQKEAEAIAKPLVKLIKEKCTALDDELEQVTINQLKTGDEQQVVKVMHKLAGWKTQTQYRSCIRNSLLGQRYTC